MEVACNDGKAFALFSTTTLHLCMYIKYLYNEKILLRRLSDLAFLSVLIGHNECIFKPYMVI